MNSDFQLILVGDATDFGFDWDDGWLGTNETISSSSWAIGPSGPTLSSTSVNGGSTVTSVTVAVTSAHANSTYQLTNTIVSSNGITDARAITLRVAYP